MLRLVPEGDFDEVIEEMNAALQEVQTGEITTAVRDAEIDGVKVKEGQIIALYNRQLVCAAATLEEACLCLLDKAGASSYELVTLFFGENVTQHQAGHLGETIRAAYPNLEVEIQEGGQPHYQYILSIE
jgi:dihydroxyacetone kinase-like predicted kinase